MGVMEDSNTIPVFNRIKIVGLLYNSLSGMFVILQTGYVYMFSFWDEGVVVRINIHIVIPRIGCLAIIRVMLKGTLTSSQSIPVAFSWLNTTSIV